MSSFLLQKNIMQILVQLVGYQSDNYGDLLARRFLKGTPTPDDFCSTDHYGYTNYSSGELSSFPSHRLKHWQIRALNWYKQF